MELTAGNISNVCIDYGNTRIKLAVFVNDELKKRIILLSWDALMAELKEQVPCNVIFSSVREASSSLDEIKSIAHNFVELSHVTPLPITNAYKTPKTLGKDRLAAVVGAWTLKPQSNSLVVDLGTAATFDFISSGGRYLGGTISPGLNMRLKSLNYFTDKLPLVEPVAVSPLLGADTSEALRSGAFNGMLFEIEGYIRRMRQKYESLFVFLTGGDAFYFENRLKSSIFANENLVLIGLNRILNYNVE